MTVQNHPVRTSAVPRRGVDLLHDPAWNKGTAFTEAERDALGLRGLLPPRVVSMDEQLNRVVENYGNKTTDLERFIYLSALQDRNETLFYRLLIENIEEMMPIVYTPTVGHACQRFAHIWRRAHGMYISAADRGHVLNAMANWRDDDVRVIVVTDGERILGLGDLGASGMGIPIGKLALYSACAGVHPQKTLPIMLDTGCDNEEIRNDTLYLGLRQPRLRGAAYDELVEEFVRAANERWPGVIIQFEDFANANSFRLLEKYRDQVCTFNDDIQGTAAVTLSGLLSALRITGKPLTEQRVLFLGAGSAGVGIGRLIAAAMETAGLSEAEAKKRCCFVDSQGLV
ncbi:oxaloacetate-decarboxylating malate dehydrogenase, partial [bacterium]|nr:oxaloacetate-decarboxylating malate dehydrogenase [bacterium]